MKKLVIFSIIFLTSFIFIDNVYADGSTNLGSSLEIDSSKFKYYDLRTMTQEEKLEIGNDKVDSVIIFSKDYAENYILENDNVDNYIIYHNISGSNPYTLICFYDSSKIIKNYLSTYFSSIKDNSNHFLSMGFVFDNQCEYSARIAYNSTNGAYLYGTNNGSNYYEFYQLINVYYYNASQKKITTNYNVNILFDTNLDIKIDNSRVFYGGSSTHSYLNGFYNQILFNTGDICETLIENDTLIDNSRDFTFNDKTPNFGEIELNNNYSGNDIYSINMSLPINNYDNENYIYQFQESTDNEWYDLTDHYVSSDSSFKDVFYNNGTWYYRILDLDGNFITSTSITISTIVEETPYLTFDLSIPDFCKVNLNDINYTTCKYLNIYTHNVIEFSKVGYYSYDGENWTKFYKDTNLIVSDNSNIYFKLVDINDNNNILSTYTYSITGIDENIPNIENYGIKFINKYSKDNFYTDLSIIFYNVDTSQLNYYYSTDFENWHNINSLLEDNDIYSKKYILRVYSNSSVVAKVEDNNGNILKYSTFKITQIKEVNNFDNVFDILTNEQNIKLSLFDLPKQVYENFKNSKLGAYFLIIMSTSIIILFIRSGKK